MLRYVQTAVHAGTIGYDIACVAKFSVGLLFSLSLISPFSAHGCPWNSPLSDQVSDQQSEKIKDQVEESQDAVDPIVGNTYANPVLTKWKVGVRMIGGSSSAKNVFIAIPVPNNWPEQRVSMAEEDIPTTIGRIKFRELDSSVQQMIVTLPVLPARDDVTVTMTFLVATSQIIAPEDPSQFVRPKTSHRAGKLFLNASPDIDFHDSRLRKQVKNLVIDKPTVWDEIEAIYDWVRENIDEQDGEPSDTVDVFRDKSGCGEDKVRLFIAMCRAHKIPARMVWVEGTFYAEFMLVDSEANPFWFPASVVGIREFGSIADPRVILQKGDNIRVPEKPVHQKFVREFMSCQGTSKPAVEFIRELLPADE